MKRQFGRQRHRLLPPVPAPLAPTLPGAPAVAPIPGVLTTDREHRFDVSLTASRASLDSVVPLSGTETHFFSDIISVINTSEENGKRAVSCGVGANTRRQSTELKTRSFTLQTSSHRFSSFCNSPGYSLVKLIGVRNIPLLFRADYVGHAPFAVLRKVAISTCFRFFCY